MRHPPVALANFKRSAVWTTDHSNGEPVSSSAKLCSSLELLLADATEASARPQDSQQENPIALDRFDRYIRFNRIKVPLKPIRYVSVACYITRTLQINRNEWLDMELSGLMQVDPVIISNTDYFISHQHNASHTSWSSITEKRFEIRKNYDQNCGAWHTE